MIRPDQGTEAAVDNGQVVGDEGVVDREPVLQSVGQLPWRPNPSRLSRRPETRRKSRKWAEPSVQFMSPVTIREPAAPPDGRRAVDLGVGQLTAVRSARSGGRARGRSRPAKSNVAW